METLIRQATSADTLDLDAVNLDVRGINQRLHDGVLGRGVKTVRIHHPDGAHSLAVGLTEPIRVEVLGHAGYYVAGMNKLADVVVHGNVGWGVAENMMSGTVRVKGCASESAGASGHGGLLVIEGDASSRCGISMKGVDIVVGGNVGHVSAFMAQAGRLVIGGDAGAGLGDSLYEAVIYVRGAIKGLGADARQEPMTDADYHGLGELLARAGFDYNPHDFKRVASARTLYHWNSEHHQEY